MRCFPTVLLIMCVFYSCTDSQTAETIAREKANSIDPTIAKKSKAALDKNTHPNQLKDSCDIYWGTIDSLKNLKPSLFLEHVYYSAITNSSLDGGNKLFLDELKSHLEDDFDQYNRTPIPTRIISPIFKLNQSRPALICSPRLVLENESLNNKSHENEVIRHSTDYYKDWMSNMGQLRNYPELIPIMFEIAEANIYTYSKNESRSTKILNFGFYEDECISYYQYTFDSSNFSIQDSLIFASPFLLDIEFESNIQIDNILKNQYRNCYDCSSSFEPVKSFAHLKGVPNLFFCYTDKFSIINQYNFPSRSLVMKINDSTAVTLWFEELDLYGCSCL